MAPKNITKRIHPIETKLKVPSKCQNGATKLVQMPPINIPQAMSSMVSYFCRRFLGKTVEKARAAAESSPQNKASGEIDKLFTFPWVASKNVPSNAQSTAVNSKKTAFYGIVWKHK